MSNASIYSFIKQEHQKRVEEPYTATTAWHLLLMLVTSLVTHCCGMASHSSTSVKTPACTSSIQLGTALCRPFTGPGVHERSSYHLIPEFRGARAQWNFTDHLVKPNGFKAPPQLPYISLGHHWPVVGQKKLEKVIIKEFGGL